MTISEQEKRYFGEEPADAEPINIWLSRRLFRLGEESTDSEAIMILFMASGYVAASKPKA